MAQSMSNTQDNKSMFNDPKWKPIYFQRQWHKRRKRRRKNKMKQITQTEFINLIKEKQENAKNAYERTFQMQPCYNTKKSLPIYCCQAG